MNEPKALVQRSNYDWINRLDLNHFFQKFIPFSHKDMRLINQICQDLNIGVTFFSTKAHSIFHPYEAGKWVPASAGSYYVKDLSPLKVKQKLSSPYRR